MNHVDWYQYKQKKSKNQLARDIVKDSAHIPNFGYHGDLPLGISWGFTFSVHRDSDILARSNWEVISTDLLTKHPYTVEVTHCGHWLVGWIDHLTVKMIDKNGRITRAGLDVLAWLDRLDSYPVADEDHFSELECTEHYDNALESIRCTKSLLIDDLPDNWRGLVYEWIKEWNHLAIDRAEDCNEGWIAEDDIIEACDALGYLDTEESE